MTARTRADPTSLEDLMHPPLTTASQTTRTDLAGTWIGLHTAVVETHQVADALDVADPSVARPAVPALCAQAVDALTWARPVEQARTAPAGSTPAHQSAAAGPAETLPTDEELAEAITQSLALAVEVLDNEDEPLTTDEVIAISQAVTALCNARAALGAAIR